MRLEGIHHITAITGDAPANVEFYVGVLGLRLVKKSVNQDDPTVYHLFYSDPEASPGSDLTFFEYPGIPRGRAGNGMVHRILWRVGSPESLDYWENRLPESTRTDAGLLFADPEGLEHELLVADVPDEPLPSTGAGVPREHALLGFHGVRAYRRDVGDSLLHDTLGFEGELARGERRQGLYITDTPPDTRPLQGAGTVHHVAWGIGLGEQDAWRERLVASPEARPTPVIDRYYFRSIYFREPGGILFELATDGPGFTTDEPAETLGEKLALPPFLEDRRADIEPRLTPLPDAAALWRGASRVL
jgi:glyoxalase family protein